jgi:hypothetical protein
MNVGELIVELQKLPQDATVICAGLDYPEPVTSVSKIYKKDFDGYYTPEWGKNSNPNLVIRLG